MGRKRFRLPDFALFRVPEVNVSFCESRFGGLKIANRRFEAIRANHSHVMKVVNFISAN